MNTQKFVGCNDAGRRVGQSHHNAVLTDHEVELLLQLHEQGWGAKRIAKVMDVGRSTVRDIVSGRRRAQTPVMWRPIQGARKAR